MNHVVAQKKFDVVVVGAGIAGVASAIAAAKNGASTLLVDGGPIVGGDILTGMGISGCLNTHGEWIVGGVAAELFDFCARHDGFIGSVFDWRAIWWVCADPVAMQAAIHDALGRYGVTLRINTVFKNAVLENGRIRGVVLENKGEAVQVSADMFIDATGDGDLAVSAGAPFEMGGPKGELQPLSIIFRLGNVDFGELMAFVRDHPENAGFAENPSIGKSAEECAREHFRQGLPKIFFSAKGPFLRKAIADGDLHPCAFIAVTPVSLPRREVSINSTRIAGVNALHGDELGDALAELSRQVISCTTFLKKHMPGFGHASLAAIGPKIGIRETRRIMGEYVLTADDVLNARKRDDGIAKGGHELDIHGAGTDQIRDQIRNGGSYDIPFGSIVPKGVTNLLLAGRCISATREANGSARVMGTCMALGQAAGTAAAMCAKEGTHPRQLSVGNLRDTLKAQGSILDGTA